MTTRTFVPTRAVERPTPPCVTGPILVAEDDACVRAMFRLLLEAEGYAVAVAADGLAALQLACTIKPSLLILDLGLPIVDGFEVATSLRACYGDALPIILVTADHDADDVAASILARSYFRKPVDVEDLLAAVRARFERSCLDIERHQVVPRAAAPYQAVLTAQDDEPVCVGGRTIPYEAFARTPEERVRIVR